MHSRAAVVAVARHFAGTDIVTGLWDSAMLYLTGIWTEDEIKKYLRKKRGTTTTPGTRR